MILPRLSDNLHLLHPIQAKPRKGVLQLHRSRWLFLFIPVSFLGYLETKSARYYDRATLWKVIAPPSHKHTRGGVGVGRRRVTGDEDSGRAKNAT